MLDAPRVLLTLAIALLVLLITATLTYDSPYAKPTGHPQFEQMEVGGVRAIEDAKHWRMGLAFGVVMIMVFMSLLMIGVQNIDQRRPLQWMIAAGAIVYISAFVAVMVAYRNYATAETPSLTGPFPAPTTIMMFGLWAAPVVFTLIYCIGFHRWFVEDEDDAVDKSAVIQTGEAD